ncbi:MAG: insulinase family protein [Ferruginibacter sp.]
MKLKCCFIVIVVAISLNCIAQQSKELVPFDKNVRLGKLSNGLTYYIRKNVKPEKRAELRLVVNAGSVLEKDEQQGIAHFLEHMAFNGTEHFPKNELLSYLQKSGVRFGADLNATTTFDYTLYMLPIPSDDEKILDNGYQVLRDWAGGLLLEEDEINKERGIILEEKRMRQNAGQRMFTQYLPAMTNKSKYGDRIPIGKEEIIKNAPRKVFVDYYKDWYRPNNMAVMVVGDIDVTKTETLIRALFSDLKNPANAPVRPEVTPINWHKINKAKLVSDAENTNNSISINIGLERMKEQDTWNAYENDLLNEVISALFGNRLQENFVNPKSPVGFGSIDPAGSFLKGYTTTVISAMVKDEPAAAINLMVGEVLKAKQFGFTQAELENVRKDFLKRYEEALLEKDKTESSEYINEYVEHFLNQQPSPGIEAEQKVVKKIMSELTLAKVNTKIKSFDLDKPSFILFNATDAMKNSITEDGLLTAFQKAKSQKVEAYVEKKTGNVLMDIMPVAGTVLKTEPNVDFDSKLLTLSNGIRVIYKKTNFKNDEVLFRASQWGGTANLTEHEITTAKYFSLAGSLGLGKNKAIDMPKLMSGVEANVYINPGPYQLMMNGNASAKDLEIFFQLIYLKMTAVNFDAEEFEGIKTNYASQVTGLLKNPVYKFFDTLNKFKYNYTKRLAGFPLEAELKALQLKELKDVYTKLTGNLNGTVMVFVGNIDEDKFTGLVEKYIASIPTLPTAVVLNKENLLKPITGKNEFIFKSGKENKSEINHAYYGDANDIADKDNLVFTLLTELLQMKATEKLREEMGNTYSPKVNSMIMRPPVATYNLGLNVSSLPENVDKIVNAFDALVKSICDGSVSDEDLVKCKAQRLKTFENQFKTNGYWSNLLEQQFTFGFSTRNITEYEKRLAEVSKADIINVARKYLSNSNILKGVMNPE